MYRMTTRHLGNLFSSQSKAYRNSYAKYCSLFIHYGCVLFSASLEIFLFSEFIASVRLELLI